MGSIVRNFIKLVHYGTIYETYFQCFLHTSNIYKEMQCPDVMIWCETNPRAEFGWTKNVGPNYWVSYSRKLSEEHRDCVVSSATGFSNVDSPKVHPCFSDLFTFLTTFVPHFIPLWASSSSLEGEGLPLCSFREYRVNFSPARWIGPRNKSQLWLALTPLAKPLGIPLLDTSHLDVLLWNGTHVYDFGSIFHPLQFASTDT